MKNRIVKKKISILIVDDASENLHLLRDVLEKRKYQVSTAAGGKELFRVVKKVLPDLILLDIMMPDIDGYTVCRRLKKNPGTANIPVIFITARTKIDDIVKGFESGGVDYVKKPFNTTELLARVQTHIELKKQREKLHELSISKDRFFSIIAHDLRSPFTSIISCSRLLNEAVTTWNKGEIKLIARELDKTSRNTFALLSNLLEWTKIQKNDARTEPEEIDLKNIVILAFSLLEESARIKNISIQNNITETVMLYADNNMTDTIFRNILANAIKFTKNNGKVIISVEKKNGFAKISISDNGVGIKKEIIQDIFNIKIKTSTPGTEGEKGTGFGLLLCKEFVAKNRGEIGVKSSPGKGSTFWFTLPLVKT